MGVWGLCLFTLAGTITWTLCQRQAGAEGSLSLEKQFAGFGLRAWAAPWGSKPSLCPFLLKTLSLDTPSHHHLLLSNFKSLLYPVAVGKLLLPPPPPPLVLLPL